MPGASGREWTSPPRRTKPRPHPRNGTAMPIIAGTLTARFWRVLDALPANFKELAERNLPRHAFKPIDVERGELQSSGWVNIRQVLDARLTLDKVMVRDTLLVGLRQDRLAINQRLFRAQLAQEIGKKLREVKRDRLTQEERVVMEDKVRMDLIRRTMPATSIYEAAWHMPSGLVAFSSTGERLCGVFSDLFTETFQVSIQAQFPYLRAQKWAETQGVATELQALLPAPFSPHAPVDVVEEIPEEETEEK
jgi:hypothetical protein